MTLSELRESVGKLEDLAKQGPDDFYAVCKAFTEGPESIAAPIGSDGLGIIEGENVGADGRVTGGVETPPPSIRRLRSV